MAKKPTKKRKASPQGRSPSTALSHSGRPPARFNLQVQFPELWGEEPFFPYYDTATLLSGHLWPPELWEAFFATLFREVKRRDPLWAKNFQKGLGAAIQLTLPPKGSGSPKELVTWLKKLRIPPSKPGPKRGRTTGLSPERVDFLHRSLRNPLVRGWRKQTRRYDSKTLGDLQKLWGLLAGIEDSWQHSNFPHDTARDFLREGKPPDHVAKALLNIGLSPQGKDREEAITKALQRAKPFREVLDRLHSRLSPHT